MVDVQVVGELLKPDISQKESNVLLAPDRSDRVLRGADDSDNVRTSSSAEIFSFFSIIG